MDRLFGFLLALGFCASATAANLDIGSMADDFHNAKVMEWAEKQEGRSVMSLLGAATPNHIPGCDEDEGRSCMDVACEKLGSLGCDQMSEIEAVGQACRGNYSGKCLEVSCQFLGSLGCDQMSEVSQVAEACVGNRDGECIENICKRLGSLGCDQMSEITKVAKSCSGRRGEDSGREGDGSK